MRLTRIEAKNLYGRAGVFDVHIDPVTVVTGPNESGKSTILGCVRLALEGPTGATWPLLGERPAYDWRVKLTFDDGFDITRGMYQGEHFVELDGTVAGIKEAATRIDARVGPAHDWTVSDLMTQSAKSRLEWLEARVLDGAGWSVEEVLGRLHTAMPRLDATLHGAAGVEFRVGATGRETVNNALAALHDADLAADREARRLSKVVEQDDIVVPIGLPSGTVASWAAERERLDKRIAELSEQIGHADGLAASYKTWTEDQDRVWSEIRDLQSTNSDVIAVARANKLSEAQAAVTACTAELGNVDYERDAVKADLQQADTDLAAKLQALQTARARADLADEVLDAGLAFDDLANELRDFGVCGAVRSKLQRLGTAIEQLAKGPGSIQDIEAQVKAATTRRDALNRTWVRVDAARTNLATKLRSAAVGERVAQAALTEVQRDRALQQRRISELTEQHESLTKKLAEAGTVDSEPMRLELVGVRELRTEAQRNMDRLSDDTARRTTRAKHRADLDAAVARRNEIRAAIKRVEPIQADMLRALFDPMRDRVSSFTREVLGADFDVTVNGGWGWSMRRGDDGHGHGSRSGQVVAQAGLHVAIAERLGGWRHIIIDDLENLEGPRRTALTDALYRAVDAGRLDNVIVASVADGWDPLEGQP